MSTGGMFAGDIEIPRFNEEIRELVLQRAADDFDWSQISPTIFGAVFESTLNPETRRAGGMHYTSIENIHKVIDPLFLDGLRAELSEISSTPVLKTRKEKALSFQRKLAGLKFLDPACGSGNFLTESYTSLRRLENEALRILYGDNRVMGELVNPIRVSISQFYGIEINDFACSVAQTALWIAELQMMRETDEIVGFDLDPLPLRAYTNIREGNALLLDWNAVVPASEADFIMGNPPFVGARIMSRGQKDDLAAVFGGKWKNLGNLDYVSGWYKKAADYMLSAGATAAVPGAPAAVPETRGKSVRAALVSTNSICQGESVAALWKPLMEAGVHIDFAWRTFRWDSEASQKAHVHCVIVGFSTASGSRERFIVDEAGTRRRAERISAYLLDAGDVFIGSRTKPLCAVPEIGIGNKPIDGGNYLFTKEEMDEFIKKEPASAVWFRPFWGSYEFINREPRYCLWLGDCPPNVLRSMPECMKRVKAVRDYRLASPSAGTVKLAERPTRFHVENMPESEYIVVPRVSSEKRAYVPMGFLSPDNLCSDAVQIIPSATLYHLGVLESSVHMAWMRAVCGRLKSDYRYSKDIVYNNFPWPSADDVRKERIGRTAQGILDARALYPECSLADLYDELTMPAELRRAHRDNDIAVLEAYGFPEDASESDIVARLFSLYQTLTA